MIILGFYILEKRAQGIKRHSQDIISRLQPSNMTYHCSHRPTSPGWGCVYEDPSGNLRVPFHIVPVARKSLCVADINERDLVLCLLKDNVSYINYVEFFWRGPFSQFIIYSVISQKWINVEKKFFKKRGRLSGSVGWPSDFGWGHDLGLWVRAPRQALCWQLGAWSLLRILCLLLAAPHPLMLCLCVSKMNKH